MPNLQTSKLAYMHTQVMLVFCVHIMNPNLMADLVFLAKKMVR